MIIVGVPSDLENYYRINCDYCMCIHLRFYAPEYIKDGFVYFKKTKELEEYLESTNKQKNK